MSAAPTAPAAQAAGAAPAETAPAGTAAAEAPAAGPAAAPEQTPATAPEGRERRPLFDNAKFAAVALVVCAHTWMPLVGADRTIAAAVLTVAAFAMPVFVTLCGWFAQPRPGRPVVDGRRLVAQVALPYLVFQVLYNVVGMVLERRPAAFSLLEPRWLTWFLLSLFVWRLTVPVWTALRHPLAVAVLVAAGSGAVQELPAELALSRTLAFLPWFVLGLVLRPHHLRALRHPAARRWAPAVLASVFAVLWLVAPKLLNPGWVEYTDSAAQLHVPYPVWLAVRAALGLLSLAAAAAFTALLPDRRTRWTALGAASLYVYLLHGLPLKAVQASGIYHLRVLQHAYTALPVLGACALTLAVVLALPAARRLTAPLVQPPAGPLLLPERKVGRGEA
ncbi:acyltransferase family protein [Kitasatospora sp. NE20-6]|uniref:acyltransferase family protein n=1 Tax=Kitasatospora sp. NE20-6 TaxID=2859066 RepID=UPI0038B2CDA1